MNATKINNGGSAFPVTEVGGDAPYVSDYGLTKRQWFAAHAPAPDEKSINTIGDIERSANPHNYDHMPRRRSYLEIEASLRYAWADAMIAQSDKA